MSNRLRWTLLLVLALLAPAAAFAASPDGTVPDAWVLDESGRVSGAYSAGGTDWTESAAEQLGNVEITLSGGGTTTVSADIGQDSVLVNDATMSYQSTTAGRPPFSIVGLGATLGSVGLPNQTSVEVDLRTPDGPLQNPDTTDKTVQVQIQAFPRPGLAGDTTNLTIRWRINGGPPQSTSGPTHQFFLARNGAWTIDVSARQGGSFTDSTHVIWNVTIAGADDARDTDGDGLPDLFESEFDFDPLTTDWNRDKDANGAPDFVDIVCTDQGFGDATLDTDFDEKPDCEETLRGTDPFDFQLDYPDRPVNGSFYQVEYLLDGQVYSDEGETTPEFELARVLVATPGSSLRYDTQWVPDDNELIALGLTENDIPIHMRNGVVKVAMNGGLIPDQVRVAPDQSLVVIAWDSGGINPDRWVARAWIDAEPELRPDVVTPAMIGLGTTWTTGQEWLTAYINYLSANLVQPHVVNLSPATGLGSSLLESAAAYYAQLSEGAMVIFGDPLSSRNPDAVRAIQQVIGAKVDPNDLDPTNGTSYLPGRKLDDLHAELMSIAQPGQLAAGFATTVAGYYADVSSFPEEDTLRAAAALLQGDPQGDDAVARYLPRLLTRITLADLQALPQPQYDALVDPAGDADGDGLTNAEELEKPPPDGTDPQLADTDGDTYPDSWDPCPASFANDCLAVAYQTMDSDGDGIVDAIDVCMNTADPDQIDTNGDGLGDACARYAHIEKPTSNLKIFAGKSVDFESKDSNMLLHTPPLGYAWDFDGAAAPSTAEDPGTIVFSTPGDYGVSLVVTEDGGGGQSTPPDVRTIVVVLAAPWPTADAGTLYIGVEGTPIAFSGSGVAGSGVITGYDWTFGDGNVGAGPTPSHTYATSGVYIATLTVKDTGNNTGMGDVQVLAFDSVPEVSFQADVATGIAPLQVQFTDASTAYDGITGRTWIWGDGKPDGTGTTPSHVFTAPGHYDVTLEVADGDGSLATAVVAIDVIGQVPALGGTATWLLAIAIAVAGAASARRWRQVV
jgi:PKD repeat protein